MKSHWSDWGHPLRPNAEDIQSYSLALEGCKNILLLGETEELKKFTTQCEDKLTTGTDWFNLPYEYSKFDAVIGDGIINVAGIALLDSVTQYIKPGGKFIVRVFLFNDSKDISPNFNIAKFQSLESQRIKVQSLYDKYGDTPTTRDYNGSLAEYYFPKLENLPGNFEVINPSYSYGQYFPLIVWTV